MAAPDVIAQDGGHGNVKLHPYLITLVRWCVSCLWSTASVLVHRLLAAPLPRLPQLNAGKPGARVKRAAGSEHLHEEPRVECVVLHAPAAHELDVVFVHGLYGSLGNTWRQGEWRTKYKLDPTRVPLRNHSSEPCGCAQGDTRPPTDYSQPFHSLNQLNCLQSLPDSLITEQFYNNTLLRENYDTQGQFVTQLFKNDCGVACSCPDRQRCSCASEVAECKCKAARGRGEAGCEVGCGCVCDECYSGCWPRDWLKEDFPGARVISVNYTSDPYLWRPLWVKGSKRMRLHERAEQMTAQLLALGVGRRPVVWVGHSKGGLFIKQIYCAAYEAHLKLNKSAKNNNSEDQSDIEYNKYNNNNHSSDKYRYIGDEDCRRGDDCDTLLKNFIKEHSNVNADASGTLRSIDDMNEIRNNHNSGDNSYKEYEGSDYKDIDYDSDMFDGEQDTKEHGDALGDDDDVTTGRDALSSNDEGDRARLWAASRGFMFYSVPHRGSPLADIKTPLTTRSVELMEIAKDCPLVLELQARWLAASARARPLVRGLVETSRTLMSVLWLRIVSEDSADAGVGVLHGVSVDHREICKPASRRCLLYTELTRLIRGALGDCRCQ